MMQRGVGEALACRAAYNGKGPWVNAKMRAMNIACNNAYFRKLGLIPVPETLNNLQYGFDVIAKLDNQKKIYYFLTKGTRYDYVRNQKTHR